MKEAVTVAAHQVVVRETAELGDPDSGGVLLRVATVGICGSDFHIFEGAFPDLVYPVRQGHEFSGWVEAIGAGYEGELREGALVSVRPFVPCGSCFACRRRRANCCAQLKVYGAHIPGALAERVVVPVANAFVAHGLSPPQAAFVEPMSIGVQIISRGDPGEGDKVLVLGAGAIGHAAAIAARSRGASVMVVDRIEARLDSALVAGAEEVVNTAHESLEARAADWTNEEGPLLVVETTGSSVLMRKAIDVAAASGRVVFAGTPTEDPALPAVTLIRKELDVLGSRNSRDTFPAAMELVRLNTETVDRLITHRFPLTAANEAFRIAVDEPASALKVMIDVGHAGVLSAEASP